MADRTAEPAALPVSVAFAVPVVLLVTEAIEEGLTNQFTSEETTVVVM